MIEAKNLTIQYIKEYATIFDANFSIDNNTLFLSNKDEICALFRVLSKIEKDYSGSIRLNNMDIKQVKNRDLSIAYVPDQPYLFSLKSVKKNLSYPLKIRKVDKNDIVSTVDSYIEKYIPNFPNKTKLLSNSQKKIVSLLRALTWKPKYLILEHFFENLDKEYIDLAKTILSNEIKLQTVIASEKDNIDCYKDYKILTLDNGSIN